MERPEPKDEYDLIIRRLCEGLRYAFPKATIALDEGERDPEWRPFEKFEVFFMLPEACDVLDGRDIDSTLVFEMLIYQAVKAIEDRYRQLLPSMHAPVRGIGIHKETRWRFGDDVREAEAMLGDQENPGDIPACWTLWARYVLPIDQKAARCKTAKISLPPELPERAGTRWVMTPEGLIKEELIEGIDHSGNTWNRIPRWQDSPQSLPDDQSEGYEVEEEDEEEDWER